ncbi:hypothetical protein EVAR_26741_1 [Eumeta japonica]|uniref:Uncharacterized protein n=1 Tax=Eumeta variegata TaxID=151549 RepID=A0A4C1XD90_EUMVA|nr:hypothetical protein EVAR_26741_1 [Eumeta japonica]
MPVPYSVSTFVPFSISVSVSALDSTLRSAFNSNTTTGHGFDLYKTRANAMTKNMYKEIKVISQSLLPEGLRDFNANTKTRERVSRAADFLDERVYGGWDTEMRENEIFRIAALNWSLKATVAVLLSVNKALLARDT